MGAKSSVLYPSRYISLGLFFMGCGSLLFSLPHFLTDLYISRDEAAKLVEDDFEVSVNKGLLCGVADGASEMMQCQDVNNLVRHLNCRVTHMAVRLYHDSFSYFVLSSSIQPRQSK